ncbi:MAG: hypothetical protein AAGD10_09320 [Myxococcota bacterium]
MRIGERPRRARAFLRACGLIIGATALFVVTLAVLVLRSTH